MKTIRSLAALICGTALLAAPTFAESVSSQQAIQAAANFLKFEQGRQQQAAATSGAKALAVSIAGVGEAHVIRDDGENVLAHVVDLKPTGFIIVSADTRVEAILGYSFTGSFSFEDSRRNVLLHLVQWDMQERLRILDGAGEAAKQLVATGTSKWRAIKGNQPAAGGPTPQASCSTYPSDPNGWLTDPTWEQWSFYNNFCPRVYSSLPIPRSPVGCVATAMAQILNYWRFPSSISFSTADTYTTASKQIAIDADSATRAFPSFATLNGVLANITYAGTQDEKAYLSFACGIKVHMDYAMEFSWTSLSFQSGAFMSRVAPAFKDGCGYGSARAAYNSTAWTTTRARVIENLKIGWPVQIGISEGAGSGGGHSVVLEGYDECNDKFLINMGWGGSYDAYYSLPDFSTGFNHWRIVDSIIYDIAPYRGWYQVGADEKNSYKTIYSGPASGLSKWDVSEPSGPEIKGAVVGTGNRICVAYSNNQSSRHYSYILVCDQYGTVKRRINIPDYDYEISPPAQNSKGEVFVAGQYEYATSGNTFLYRINPNTGSVTKILTLLAGEFVGDYTVKVDDEDWVYARSSQKLYCMDSTGTLKWTFTLPHNGMGYRDEACSIDRARQNVYVPYYDSSTQTSYLGCINRLTGALRFERAFTSIPTASRMTSAASIGADGTVYVGTRTKLYALNPDASLADKWTPVDPSSGYGLITIPPAIGSDGTLYAAYWIQVSGVDKVAFAAFSPVNGSKKWEKLVTPSSDYDNPYRGYATQDGKVYFFSRDNNVAHRLRMIAYQDTGSDATQLFTQNYGQDAQIVGFGPGSTMYLTEGTTVHAVSGGDRGDPEGAGMAFLNNQPPNVVTNLSPANGATNLATTLVLTWQGSDPDGHALKYDVFVGDPSVGDGHIPPYVTQITSNSVSLTGLKLGTTYTWQVVATDGQALNEGTVWTFTTQPPPQLLISRAGNNVVISWSTNTAGFSLECTTNLFASPIWTSVSPAPVISGANYVVTNAVPGAKKFYRLKK